MSNRCNFSRVKLHLADKRNRRSDRSCRKPAERLDFPSAELVASSDTSGKRTCGNIHNGISILLEVQSSSFQTICPFPLRVLPFASGSRSTVCCLPLRIEARSKLSLSLSLSFYSFLSLLSFVQFFFSSPLAWNRNSSARREKNSAIISLSDHFATLSFRSIFLHRGTEYFPPWFRVFLSPFT